MDRLTTSLFFAQGSSNKPHIVRSWLPIPVAERFKARVCGRSLAGIAGLNPAGDKDVCVVCSTARTKNKREHNQDTEVWIKYRVRTKKVPPRTWMYSKDKEQGRTMETKKRVGKMYKGRQKEGVQKKMKSRRVHGCLLWVLCVVR